MPEPATTPVPPTGRLARLAGVAWRRRGRVLAGWIVALVAILAIGPQIAGDWDADYSTPGSESKAAADRVAAAFPAGGAGETIDVVWQARDGARGAAARARVDPFLAQAVRLEGIAGAQPPQVAPDGTIAIVRLELDRPAWDVPRETGEALIERAQAASGDGVRIELGGGPIQDAQGGTQPETVGLLGAAIVLLIAFGSVVAAGLPLLIALFGLGISATLIGVLALAVDVPDWATAVAGLIGIGVGIDYSLLILTRYRAALAAGRDVPGALAEALTTAGRSVLVAGTTVVISMLGLFLMGVSYLRGVALSASLAVLVVMAAAVTLLPALLAFVGTGVNRLRIPALHRGGGPERPALAARWSRAIQRAPWPAALAGAAVLLALAAPIVGLRLGFPDAGNDRAGTTTRAAYDLAARGFGPGANGPLLVVGARPAAQPDGAPAAVARRLRDEPGVAFASAPRRNPAGDTAMIVVVPATAPQDDATQQLVHRLRDDLDGAAPGGDGALLVGGATASFIDQSEYVSGRLPLFIAAVVGLSFLLLLLTFRAPVVALKAALLTLLSVGAAYGVIALVAEGGALGGLIGIDEETPIAPFIPVLMFAILFGLSMDYEVFLLSRVREEYLRHGDTARAVTDGLARTARVITAAAAIMVVVFLAFLVADEVFLKLIGIGMATAILVDATIVRMVLVPAVMQLLGERNWWMPRWLERALPDLEVEPASAGPPPGAGR